MTSTQTISRVSLSEVIKNINNVSLLGFKKTVKTILLDRYTFTYNIPNCYVFGVWIDISASSFADQC